MRPQVFVVGALSAFAGAQFTEITTASVNPSIVSTITNSNSLPGASAASSALAQGSSILHSIQSAESSNLSVASEAGLSRTTVMSGPMTGTPVMASSTVTGVYRSKTGDLAPAATSMAAGNPVALPAIGAVLGGALAVVGLL